MYVIPWFFPIALAAFSVRYTTLDGEPRTIPLQSLALPALPASAFNAIAEDEAGVGVADAGGELAKGARVAGVLL